MKQILALTTVATLSLTPVHAQETEDGFNLMEEGAKLLLRGLMTEIEPAIDDMRKLVDELGPAMEQFAVEMGPVMAEILSKVDDLSNYQQPEFLPNGDIIIRRKPDAPLIEMDEGIDL